MVWQRGHLYFREAARVNASFWPGLISTWQNSTGGKPKWEDPIPAVHSFFLVSSLKSSALLRRSDPSPHWDSPRSLSTAFTFIFIIHITVGEVNVISLLWFSSSLLLSTVSCVVFFFFKGLWVCFLFRLVAEKTWENGGRIFVRGVVRSDICGIMSFLFFSFPVISWWPNGVFSAWLVVEVRNYGLCLRLLGFMVLDCIKFWCLISSFLLFFFFFVELVYYSVNLLL